MLIVTAFVPGSIRTTPPWASEPTKIPSSVAITPTGLDTGMVARIAPFEGSTRYTLPPRQSAIQYAPADASIEPEPAPTGMGSVLVEFVAASIRRRIRSPTAQ